MQDISKRQMDQFLRQYVFDEKINYSILYYRTKRLLDITIALFSLILLLPVMGFIAICVKLSSPGPVLFMHERVGAKRKTIDGRICWEFQTFPFYKFRTMWVDVTSDLHEEYIEAYIEGDEAKMSSYDSKSSTSYKLVDDPRVTKVGKVLRQLSLDELPQLWNIIKGDMSLVGPRPPIPYEVKKYRREHLKRLAATPGLTGLWQVSGRSETTFEEMIHLDIEYIEKQSLWLDIKILFLTVPAVISEKGAG
jgi:lipopolysaccharide/colanic/teichoic acid biosynthesis glycosyltransferase